MKVSVLVTFYNQEQYVDEALGSIFSQDCDFDFEVLIGDDGSTDGTMEKIKSWQERYPKQIQVFVMERDPKVKYNGSQRASRNRLNLLKHVSGEYFLFLDGDDFYTDDRKLKRQVEILDDPQNAAYVMCAHNVYSYEEKTKENKPFLPVKKVLRLKASEYWGHYYFHPDSIMMRSKYIPQIPVDLVADYFNDNTITYCFLRFGGVYYIPDLMASYRQTGDGIWTGNSKFVGTLRNLMDLDLEYRINPQLYRYSLIRHRADIRAMISTRGKNDETKLSFYENRIREDGMKFADAWLGYNLSKRRMDKQMRTQYGKACVYYVIYHVLWILTGK
jgi:glycosyltransferase involved in cell wall biosynthesis